MSGNGPHSPLGKVLGLWENESRNGGTYFSGRWGDFKVLILPNRDHVEGDSLPTHNLLLSYSPKEKRDGQDRRPPPRREQQTRQRELVERADSPPPYSDADNPF